MNIAQTNEPTPSKSLRLWPGIVAAILLCVVKFIVPLIVADAVVVAMLGGLVGALAILVWWLFFSRAPWPERVGAIVLMIVALLATRPVLHKSIATGGMGALFFVFAVPVMTLALVAWAIVSRRFSSGLRYASMVVVLLLACGVFALLRTGGISGAGDSDLHWRWTPSPEEKLLAQTGDEPKPLPLASAATETPKESPAAKSDNASATTSATPTEAKTEPAAAITMGANWPGFRGAQRDGIVRGVRIKTDWAASPPVEMWRRPIGPGWSSFAVRGDLLYTQEQRGEDEVVTCYKVSTGEPVWRHSDKIRFWESNAGAGPRATPTLSNGRVYAFGATGVLNVLDAATGKAVWSRNVASETDTKTPIWGFSSSPLVVDDVVIVAAAGTLAGYDIATGQRRWIGPAHGVSYSSPHRTTIDGVVQILLLSSNGATSVAPADGKVLWEHGWEGGAIVQPALMTNGDILINALAGAGGAGTRRLAVSHKPDGWSVEERWTSIGLKPYFNDFVVHKGHAYGFDGSILSCIDLNDGARKWKGGRYGNGQLVLLPEQDVMLVLSEEGELALVGATTDQFKEIARFRALDGKTWNHPVVVGDVLLVRNGEEMAAFRLSLASPLAGR